MMKMSQIPINFISQSIYRPTLFQYVSPYLYNNRLGSWALVELKCLTYLSTEAGDPTKSFLLFGE